MIKQRQREEVKKAYLQFQEIAKSLGVSVEDILKEGKTVKNKRPIKYQDPNNAEQGWSGQGRKPRWLEEALSKGKKLEDFLVK
ncbi:MAG: H-NS histone family protein [Moraxella sp.]|nr:H-NS histone family protein [Moraxella sp.]